MVQGRDARLVATDCKRSRRSGAGSDKPKREGNTPNSPRSAENAEKREWRIPGCKAEKAKRAKGCDHNGREGHAQVVPNQTGKQSRQPDPVTGLGSMASNSQCGSMGWMGYC